MSWSGSMSFDWQIVKRHLQHICVAAAIGIYRHVYQVSTIPFDYLLGTNNTYFVSLRCITNANHSERVLTFSRITYEKHDNLG